MHSFNTILDKITDILLTSQRENETHTNVL